MDLQDKTIQFLLNESKSDKHFVNIPVEKEPNENSRAYWNDDEGITIPIPEDYSFLEDEELINFYNECSKNNSYSKNQLKAIMEVLKYKQWNWLNKCSLEDIKEICNSKYSSEYILSFAQIMHYNRRITPDIFFKYTNPDSKLEFLDGSNPIGFNVCSCCIVAAGGNLNDIKNAKYIYENTNPSSENLEVLRKMQYKINHSKGVSLEEIINFYKDKIK